MKTSLRTVIICLAAITATVAAVPGARRFLTPQRAAELTAPSASDAPRPAEEVYKVEISGLGSTTIPSAQASGEIKATREQILPTQFDAPQAAANGAPVVTPPPPRAFEVVNTGWTIRLTAKPAGKLIAIYGIADYAEAEMVPGGHGATAGPIRTDDAKLITANKPELPKLQTTTTRFNIFAVPGASNEVTLFRGARPEKHMIKVSIE